MIERLPRLSSGRNGNMKRDGSLAFYLLFSRSFRKANATKNEAHSAIRLLSFFIYYLQSVVWLQVVVVLVAVRQSTKQLYV